MGGKYMGDWGAFGGQPQKYLVAYALSPNQQRPLAGAMHAAIFNTARRVRYQFPYIAFPLLLGYGVMTWAIDKNEYLNSKAGRQEHGFD